MIITFDGPAGSGKSTVAKLVAKHLGFVHFNSGSIFRAITAFLLDNDSNIKKLENICIKTEIKNNIQYVYINDKDYTPVLRNIEISKTVAHFSSMPEVQYTAQKVIKEFCNSHNVVIDGRGLGNEIFPNAEYKFYLDCSVKVRAQRRFLEEQKKGTNTTIEEIEHQLEIRDKLDKKRDIAPLAIPKNAIIVDSSNITIEQVVDKILTFIKI